MAGDRIRLGAGEGGGDEGEHKILFTPYLAQCKYGNAGLVVHGAGGQFESPVPGRSESVPTDNRADTVRLTSAPCNTYGVVIDEAVRRWTGPDPVRLMLLKWSDGAVEVGEVGPEDAYDFYFDDRHFKNDALDMDSLPDDVYMYIKPLHSLRNTVRPGRRLVIPGRWTQTHWPKGADPDSGPDRYSTTFCVYTVQRVDAAYPADRPWKADGYTYEDVQMLGLAESMEDDNGTWGNIELWYDMCPVDKNNVVISNKATSVGALYPLPDGNPFNAMAGIVNQVEYAVNARAYFLLYLTEWRPVRYGSPRMVLSCVCVEYLSWPEGTVSEATDPKGGRHELSLVTGIESFGWFYRRNPDQAKVNGKFPTPAKAIAIDAGYELVSPASFAGWSVNKAKSGIDDDTVWRNVQTKPDPEVPDRRYDFQVVDWGRRVVHDDAPEDN